MTIREEIGIKIRQTRVAAGQSQGALSKHLGLTRWTVGRLEDGRVALPVDRFVKIAWWFGVDPIDLLPKRLSRGRRKTRS